MATKKSKECVITTHNNVKFSCVSIRIKLTIKDGKLNAHTRTNTNFIGGLLWIRTNLLQKLEKL